MATHRSGSRTPSPCPCPSPSTSSLLRKARFYAILSLVTLAVQNTSLALVLHASRIAPTTGGSGQHDRGAYFTPAAVLCTEVAKTIICATLLLVGIAKAKARQRQRQATATSLASQHTIRTLFDTLSFSTIRKACSLVFSDSAWPLSFPAILYVLQNNLQYTAAENLEPAVFQTLYQLKILTTALFSRILLGKRLHRKQWIALLVLAGGVAIVQVGSSGGGGGGAAQHHGPPGGPPPPPPPPFPYHLPPSAQSHTGLQEEYASLMAEEIANIERRDGWWPHGPPGPPGPPPPGPPRPPPPPTLHGAASPFVGFLAVLAACVTSGLAGVWFEKVVKGGCSPPASNTPQAAEPAHAHAHAKSTSSLAALASSLSRSRSPLPTNSGDEDGHEHAGSSSSSRAGHADDKPGDDNLDLSSCTVWLSALQLSLFSLAPALVPVLVKMYAESPEGGATPDLHAPWRNFGTWAWSIVALQTVGGLVTALVVRWADNILKCFAVALALLMTSVLSIPMFDFHLTPSFVVGAGLTLFATVMYQRVGSASGGSASSSSSGGGGDPKPRGRGGDEEDVLFDVDSKDEEAIALLPSGGVRK